MNINFTQNFIALRRIYGFTQETIAEKLGVSRQAVTKWESGNSVPDIYTISNISRVFDVSIDELIHDVFDTPEKLKEISRKYNSSENDPNGFDYEKFKQIFATMISEGSGSYDALYRKYKENIEREDLTVDEIGYYQWHLSQEMDKENYKGALALCDYLMSLGHGTAYNVFDMVTAVGNILKDNYYNHYLYPYEMGRGLEEERIEYINEMRELAERMKVYSQIILAEMGHMENDRTWSFEEAEMLEMGEDYHNDMGNAVTINGEDIPECPFD